MAAVAVLFLLGATQVIGSPGRHDDCATSGCHSDGSGITIDTDSTASVDMDSSFALNVQVTGVSGQSSLTVKFPSDIADNSLFTYEDLDSEGTFSTTDDSATIDYNITAPSTPGLYTLRLYAVQHIPNGAYIDIAVTVQATGPGPAVMNVNRTPSIPTATESVNVTANVTSTVGITSVILQYITPDDSDWNNVTMEVISGDLYGGTIPELPDATNVTYRIVALDTLGIERVYGPYSYIVGNFPPPPPPIIHYGYLLGIPAIFLAYLGTALEYYDEERFTRIHGVMLSLAYILTSINVLLLFQVDASAWTALNPAYLIDTSNMLLFVHSWHIWLGIISMVFGTLAFITHLAGWKTCNLGLPAVVLWTILAFMGVYLNVAFRM